MAKTMTTVHSIYESLLAMITNFDIAPGFRLTESQLADYFQVSRTPIRAALQRLENEGHVFVRAKQGCFVRNIDLEMISDFYDVRIELELMSVRLIAQKKDQRELEALAEQWQPQSYFFGAETSAELKKAEEDFHLNLADISGNGVLVNYIRDINDQIRVVRQQGWPDQKSVDDTYSEHFNICQFLLHGELEQAEEEMINHIKKSKDQANRVSLNQIYQGKNNPFV